MTDAVERLVRIETKVDQILSQLLDHEGRLRTLEGAKAWLIGAGMAAGAVGSVLMKFIPGIPN
ncbi:hypothetical protein [Roseomonas sp. WA12]